MADMVEGLVLERLIFSGVLVRGHIQLIKSTINTSKPSIHLAIPKLNIIFPWVFLCLSLKLLFQNPSRFFGASDLQETTHTQQAPSKPAKGGALSTAGYYDPARIEVGKTQDFFFFCGENFDS